MSLVNALAMQGPLFEVLLVAGNVWSDHSQPHYTSIGVLVKQIRRRAELCAAPARKHRTTDTFTVNIQTLLALLETMHEVISIATVLSKPRYTCISLELETLP
eukprot:gnl/TRDRNA2_/TRDRNA2_172046_c1_seq3.p1 gnl/TRDRNA2_/TRDRNA2_172046_c1~~gnl/TRDRNA2_/TRDRNA2_172046_c1_seq3.p1  ORF type:complete len:103 (+),score=3.49 gnl/TRDRNA2_/TRDRNA2_172046_c1_seq3:157-465(+)